MPKKKKKKFNTHELRKLAEEIVAKLIEESLVPKNDRHDLITSLVRQWLTSDGNATLFLCEQQIFLVLVKTPLGRLSVSPKVARPGWSTELTQDWKIDPAKLPEIFAQLNRGQSIEVTNTEGDPLRLWADPKEKGRYVERLVKPKAPAEKPITDHTLAARALERNLGIDVEPDEMEALAASVVRQWERFDGHASIFLEREQLVFIHRKRADGGKIDTQHRRVDLRPVLSAYGFSPEQVPDIIAHINLGHEVEYRDKEGNHSLLWHDPKTLRFCWKKLGKAGQGKPRQQGPPAFCPSCSAVLSPWREGMEEQKCPACGQKVSFSS